MIKSFMATFITTIHIIFGHAFFYHQRSHNTTHVTEINFTSGRKIFLRFSWEQHCTNKLSWMLRVFTIKALLVRIIFFNILWGTLLNTSLHDICFFKRNLLFATFYTKLTFTIGHRSRQSTGSLFTPFLLLRLRFINTDLIVVISFTRIV